MLIKVRLAGRRTLLPNPATKTTSKESMHVHLHMINEYYNCLLLVDLFIPPTTHIPYSLEKVPGNASIQS